MYRMFFLRQHFVSSLLICTLNLKNL